MSAPLNAILSTARGALLAHQLSLQVSSHNLANALTEGFSRQRAELEPGTPVRSPIGLLGTGVRVADVSRARDALLDEVYRRDTASHHGLLARHDALARVEAALAEPSELSIAASLDSFWNAWSTLSSDPTSSSARVAVVAAGQRVVDRFRSVSDALSALQEEWTTRLEGSVRHVNDLLSRVAALNVHVVAARAGGRSAPDLEDRRDLLLDELAQYLPITVSSNEDGSLGVIMNGLSVVEGSSHSALVGQFVAGTWRVETSGGLRVEPQSGIVGGLLFGLNDDLLRLRRDLDTIARGLVERVNAVHVTGTNPLGQSGIRFFDDLGSLASVTAARLSLDSAVAANPLAVAAGTPDGAGRYRAGANDVASAIAALRTNPAGSLLSGRSVGAAYRDYVTDLSVHVESLRQATEVHADLVATARERRESVSGVATDEELVRVIQIQAAYAAAARLVQVVDEMYGHLLAT